MRFLGSFDCNALERAPNLRMHRQKLHENCLAEARDLESSLHLTKRYFRTVLELKLKGARIWIHYVAIITPEKAALQGFGDSKKATRERKI